MKTAPICLCLQESSAHKNNIQIVLGVVETEEFPLPVVFILFFPPYSGVFKVLTCVRKINFKN